MLYRPQSRDCFYTWSPKVRSASHENYRQTLLGTGPVHIPGCSALITFCSCKRHQACHGLQPGVCFEPSAGFSDSACPCSRQGELAHALDSVFVECLCVCVFVSFFSARRILRHGVLFQQCMYLQHRCRHNPMHCGFEWRYAGTRRQFHTSLLESACSHSSGLADMPDLTWGHKLPRWKEGG